MKAVITVLGMVQGVGFRPFVAGLAESMDIRGSVRNSGGIVIIECDAETGVLGEFVRRLRFLAPRGARILDIRVTRSMRIIRQTVRSGRRPEKASGSLKAIHSRLISSLSCLRISVCARTAGENCFPLPTDGMVILI